MTLVDQIAPPLRWALTQFGRPQTYTQHEGASAPLVVFIRGVRSDDLFANAMQQDIAAVVDAAAFAAAFAARPLPMRYDRLKIGSRSWSIEEWRGAPNDDAPVFFKLLLRGGTQ